MEIVVFTVNEHENVCTAGLNRRAGYATEDSYFKSLNPNKENVIPSNLEKLYSCFNIFTYNSIDVGISIRLI